MSIFETIVGGSVAAPIKGIGNVLDKLFTSDEEKLDKKILLERLLQQPALAQVEVNKKEAAHRSIFVSGWRPFIGWTCGISLNFAFIIKPLLVAYTTARIPEIPTAMIIELVIALLGLGVLRTYEKLKGLTK